MLNGARLTHAHQCTLSGDPIYKSIASLNVGLIAFNTQNAYSPSNVRLNKDLRGC